MARAPITRKHPPNGATGAIPDDAASGPVGRPFQDPAGVFPQTPTTTQEETPPRCHSLDAVSATARGNKVRPTPDLSLLHARATRRSTDGCRWKPPVGLGMECVVRESVGGLRCVGCRRLPPVGDRANGRRAWSQPRSMTVRCRNSSQARLLGAGTATLFASKQGNEPFTHQIFAQSHAHGTICPPLQDVEPIHRHRCIVLPLPDGIRRVCWS